jgi:hypothetical protein
MMNVEIKKKSCFSFFAFIWVENWGGYKILNPPQSKLWGGPSPLVPPVVYAPDCHQVVLVLSEDEVHLRCRVTTPSNFNTQRTVCKQVVLIVAFAVGALYCINIGSVRLLELPAYRQSKSFCVHEMIVLCILLSLFIVQTCI